MRNIEKSQVWRGHIQLSVSPPNFPKDLGGVPTKRTSVYLLYVMRMYWLPLKKLETTAIYFPFCFSRFSIVFLISAYFLSKSSPFASKTAFNVSSVTSSIYCINRTET